MLRDCRGIGNSPPDIVSGSGVIATRHPETLSGDVSDEADGPMQRAVCSSTAMVCNVTLPLGVRADPTDSLAGGIVRMP